MKTLEKSYNLMGKSLYSTTITQRAEGVKIPNTVWIVEYYYVNFVSECFNQTCH